MPAKSQNALKISYAYAFLLVLFVVCQLFTFDEFLSLLTSFSLPGGEITARILGCVLVTSEVFALPFLLRFSLSNFMRNICMVLSWLVPAIWLFLTISIRLLPVTVDNVGFVGTIFKVTPGIWSVYFCLFIAMAAVWSSWGLWPNTKR